MIGSFGFLNANKRIPQLLEAFAVVRARHPRARLLLVGPEAPGLELERRIDSARAGQTRSSGTATSTRSASGR